MITIARRACLVASVLAPCIAASSVPSDVIASAVCQQDGPQLSLMQVKGRPTSFLKVKTHHDVVLPTMEQLQQTVDTFMQTLQDVGQNMNTTLTTALVAGESSMRHVSDFLEVAETSATIARDILGQTGTHIVDTLTSLSNKIQGQISDFISESESFRQQLQDTLQGIYDTITGQANATMAKMQTASDDVTAAGNTSSASFMQLQATLAGLQKAVQAGCLSKADTQAILHMHGRDSLAAHFQEVDSNGDGCIRKEELEHSAKQLDTSFHREADQVALLMFRAAAGHHLSSSSALEEAVARKGGSNDPCSVATSALSSTNSSFLALQGKLEGVNESLVELMEQGIQLLEASFQIINSTIVLGLDAALDAGLPSRMAEPVEEALDTMMGGFDGVATTVKDAEVSAANSVVDAVSSFTPTFISYIDGVASKLALVCS